MSQYRTFTAQDAVEYARQFGGLDDPSSLVEAQEVGDGNLNLVFKIFDSAGVSRIVVKQALPYVRCVGESWPLTLDRARLEAQTLVEHYQHSPQHTVKIHHFDPELAVMVMEDLSSHRIWRGELINNIYYPQAARQLGEYLAHTLFHTSDFYLHPHDKKAQVAKFINPEMCEITEDLFFNDPYQIHARNSYPAELENDVAALRDDAQLKIAVASLKHRFFSHAEALLHGDIHSGSIFVADGSLKAIDAEFGYFGPIGFDVGTAIGNLLLNFCGLPGHLVSFLPTVILTYFGATAVTAMRDALPMDGLAMKTLFTVGGMLPCVGIAILLRQIVNKNIDFVPFFVGFTLAASLKLNLVSITIIALLFAVIFYKIALIKNNTKLVDSTGSLTNDDEEEDI